MCLLFEAMEAVTTSLMTTSAIAYASEMGTIETLATIQGFIQGTYYGMGKLIEAYTIDLTYHYQFFILEKLLNEIRLSSKLKIPGNKSLFYLWVFLYDLMDNNLLVQTRLIFTMYKMFQSSQISLCYHYKTWNRGS